MPLPQLSSIIGGTRAGKKSAPEQPKASRSQTSTSEADNRCEACFDVFSDRTESIVLRDFVKSATSAQCSIECDPGDPFTLFCPLRDTSGGGGGGDSSTHAGELSGGAPSAPSMTTRAAMSSLESDDQDAPDQESIGRRAARCPIAPPPSVCSDPQLRYGGGSLGAELAAGGRSTPTHQLSDDVHACEPRSYDTWSAILNASCSGGEPPLSGASPHLGRTRSEVLGADCPSTPSSACVSVQLDRPPAPEDAASLDGTAALPPASATPIIPISDAFRREVTAACLNQAGSPAIPKRRGGSGVRHGRAQAAGSKGYGAPHPRRDGGDKASRRPPGPRPGQCHDWAGAAAADMLGRLHIDSGAYVQSGGVGSGPHPRRGGHRTHASPYMLPAYASSRSVQRSESHPQPTTPGWTHAYQSSPLLQCVREAEQSHGHDRGGGNLFGLPAAHGGGEWLAHPHAVGFPVHKASHHPQQQLQALATVGGSSYGPDYGFQGSAAACSRPRRQWPAHGHGALAAQSREAPRPRTADPLQLYFASLASGAGDPCSAVQGGGTAAGPPLGGGVVPFAGRPFEALSVPAGRHLSGVDPVPVPDWPAAAKLSGHRQGQQRGGASARDTLESVPSFPDELLFSSSSLPYHSFPVDALSAAGSGGAGGRLLNTLRPEQLGPAALAAQYADEAACAAAMLEGVPGPEAVVPRPTLQRPPHPDQR